MPRQVKRASSELWTQHNPILAEGELGFETDTGKLKIGNGTTHWGSLSYQGGSSSFSGTMDDIPDGSTYVKYSNTEKSKLSGIAAGATVGVVPNNAITPGTNTKLTYDAKGLVTGGAAATASDVGAEASGAVSTHAALTTGVHGVGAGTIAKTSDIPAAASTVTAATSYGISSDAGSAATYSKGDHTHGTPDAPTSVTGNAGTVTGLTFTNSKTETVAGTFGVAWAKYDFAVNGGLVSTITPGATANTTIPAKAVISYGAVNVTTAVTSSGSATVAVGVAGTGGSTTSILAATAKASLGLNATLPAASGAAPKKTTTQGGITFTIGTAALTAGVIEVWIIYFVAG